MNRGKKLRDYLKNLDILVAGAGLVFLVFLTLAGALFRYFLSKPFTWLEEVQFILEVWVVFLGAGYGFRTGAHVAIEILVDALPRKAQRVVDVVIAVVVIGTLSYLCYQSVGYIRLFIRSARVTSYLQIPFAYIYSIVPLTCVLMIANFGMTSWKKFKGTASGPEAVNP